jgi:hypothetical protein
LRGQKGRIDLERVKIIDKNRRIADKKAKIDKAIL